MSQLTEERLTESLQVVLSDINSRVARIFFVDIKICTDFLWWLKIMLAESYNYNEF